MIVPRQLEQAGVKLNGRAPPIEHGTAEVVVDQGPGTPAEGLEGRDVPTQEALERLVQREQREEGARIAEDHHEAGDRARTVADADRTKGAPVHLCLFAGQRHHAAIDVRGRLGPQPPHQPADLHGRPGIAPEAEHLVEPCGTQAGILRQGVADEWQKGVEGTRPTHAPAEAARLVLQRGRDHHPSSGRRGATAPGSATDSPGHRPHSASGRARTPVTRQGRGVWRTPRQRGKSDPSRDGARDRCVDGPGDRGALPDCADGGPWRPAPIGGGPGSGTPPRSRRGRGRTPDRSQRGGGTSGRSSDEGAGPRCRSPKGDLRLDGEPRP